MTYHVTLDTDGWITGTPDTATANGIRNEYQPVAEVNHKTRTQSISKGTCTQSIRKGDEIIWFKSTHGHIKIGRQLPRKR